MRALSDQVRTVDIAGMLVPWNIDRPVMVIIEGKYFVAIYSSQDKLDGSMLEIGWTQGYTVKRITNGRDFVDSLTEHNVPVCLDPHCVGEVTRFTRCL